LRRSRRWKGAARDPRRSRAFEPHDRGPIERLNPPGPSEKVGRFLANITLTGAELDRQTFARDALTFEIDAELATRVGENGHEVLIVDDEDEGGGTATWGPA
jgi:hypothetical protein